jgi:hypothetical protein
VTEPTYDEQLAAVIAAAKRKLGWGLVKVVARNVAWGLLIAAGIVWWRQWPAAVFPYLALTAAATGLSISLVIGVFRIDRRNATVILSAGLPLQVSKREIVVPPAKSEPEPGLSLVRD